VVGYQGPIPGDGVAIIGLGRFGTAVAQSLVRLGHDVFAIDESPQRVQSWQIVSPMS